MKALVALALALAIPAVGCAAETPVEAGPTASRLEELSLTSIDGTPFDNASLKGKVVLFVNVASKCGYTPQYEGLQALYEANDERGLVIVGVPCNQFLGQEPGSPEEIATFCKMNYGVTFPLLEKQDVNGVGRSPLYRWLVNSEVGGGDKIGWNFEKFLVDRDGKVVARFNSKVTPDDPALVAAVEAALAAPAPTL